MLSIRSRHTAATMSSIVFGATGHVVLPFVDFTHRLLPVIRTTQAPDSALPLKYGRNMMEIKRNGSQPSQKGPAEYFTGTVRIDLLIQAPGPSRVTAGC